MRGRPTGALLLVAGVLVMLIALATGALDAWRVALAALGLVVAVVGALDLQGRRAAH